MLVSYCSEIRIGCGVLIPSPSPCPVMTSVPCYEDGMYSILTGKWLPKTGIVGDLQVLYVSLRSGIIIFY